MILLLNPCLLYSGVFVVCSFPTHISLFPYALYNSPVTSSGPVALFFLIFFRCICSSVLFLDIPLVLLFLQYEYHCQNDISVQLESSCCYIIH